MATIAELMRVLQFGDSVVPVGSFSFSNGLESAIQQKVVYDLSSLREFVLTAVHQSATSDGIAVLHAHRAALAKDTEKVILADWAVHNRKLNEEMRLMTVRMGRKLGELASHVLDAKLINDWLVAVKGGHAPGTYPVAQALVFAALNLTEQDALAVHQYGLASMMLSSALRLMRLGHFDVQTVLFQVNTEAERHYLRIVPLALDDMAAFAPMLDVLAGVHVKSHVRMFMN